MRRYGSAVLQQDIRRGLRQLSAHRPDQAVRSFRVSVDGCPATRPSELSRNLYWLAIALLQLDRPELAVRSLASAQKLRPRGFARSSYISRVNAYGMCRRSTPELDDFYAFYSIKASMYLGAKKKKCFDSNTEKDAITRLIGDAWHSLSSSNKLLGLIAAQKLTVFKTWPISFPFFGLGKARNDNILSANFRLGTKQRGEDRCSCGSGLDFLRCCGRVYSPRENSCE